MTDLGRPAASQRASIDELAVDLAELEGDVLRFVLAEAPTRAASCSSAAAERLPRLGAAVAQVLRNLGGDLARERRAAPLRRARTAAASSAGLSGPGPTI